MLPGQEVYYYMVYIAYFTDLNSKIWDYGQKRRICRENCKYALDENFHDQFCPRRKAAKFCHPDVVQSKYKRAQVQVFDQSIIFAQVAEQAEVDLDFQVVKKGLFAFR